MSKHGKHSRAPRRLGRRFAILGGTIATFAAISVAAAPAAQAEEAEITGWVSLAAPTSVNAGSTTTIRAIAGENGQAAAGDTVYLHYYADGQWHYYTSKQAGPDGRTQFKVKANETTDFRAVLVNEAGDDYTAVSYDVRVNVTAPSAPAPAAPAPAPEAAPQAATPNLDGTLGSQILALAAAELGKPYVWGAAGPWGFDCSGLVQYVYNQVGISLPHSATAQGNGGVWVSQGEAQPGDLILFGNSSYYYHVGIYAGDGMMYHAPQPGDVVKLASIWTNDYTVVRVA